MTVLIDTREQKPYAFKSCRRQKLDVGDYTTETLYGQFHIERKSPQDLYGTLTRGHMRFRRELQRAEVSKIKLIVLIECSYEIFVNLKFKGGSVLKMKPHILEKMIATMTERYKLNFVFCDSRNEAQKKLKQLLTDAEIKIKGN